ncbi:hypothetical protein OXPF_39510 [Oxobacter pfennigii]|uniref:Uncharacterized protein n=1 Tax=Oxobacter pfennigii TaxID=36849 RepID=A0A0P9AAW7_9CLOT|nr:hypothetical protein [Oxobacter pfennigii]KPU42172.1 hypothetical protein OXPF_39510 [Oxobacter pfennigii]
MIYVLISLFLWIFAAMNLKSSIKPSRNSNVIIKTCDSDYDPLRNFKFRLWIENTFNPDHIGVYLGNIDDLKYFGIKTKISPPKNTTI